MSYRTIVVTIDERIGMVTINRPDKLNALNAVVKEELRSALSGLANNPGVDVVILTGAGTKAFMAGTDIAELGAVDGPGGKALATQGQELFAMITHLGKPVIAAVNGYALGGGCELALACHVRIASENAKFGQPELLLGVIPGYGGTQRLPRLVGMGKAAEMILTGAQVDAAEALRIGLVTKVVPSADLMPRALGIARTISGMGQVAVRAALDALVASAELSPVEGMRKEAELFGRCCASEDFKEGTRAFLEKRAPVFKGR